MKKAIWDIAKCPYFRVSFKRGSIVYMIVLIHYTPSTLSTELYYYNALACMRCCSQCIIVHIHHYYLQVELELGVYIAVHAQSPLSPGLYLAAVEKIGVYLAAMETFLHGCEIKSVRPGNEITPLASYKAVTCTLQKLKGYFMVISVAARSKTNYWLYFFALWTILY